MANPLELIDKSQYIKEMINKIVSDIKEDIRKGNIKSNTEAFVLLGDKVREFIKRITGPVMTVRPLNAFPVSSDINEMIEEIRQDLEYAFNETENNLSILDVAFNKMDIERSMLNNMSKLINKRLEDLETNINEMFASTIYEVFTETFINLDNVDESMVSGTPAFIDLNSGCLTLARSSVKEYNERFNVALSDNCNGFPGDTHQAYASGGEIVFSGELEPHVNLEALLDKDRETWFEYESIKIDPNDFEKTGGFGFEYQEGVSWITEDDVLVLELILTSGVARMMNWISLSPFLPTERSYMPAKITSIVISDGRGTIQELCNGPISFKEDVIMIFKNQNVKEIKIRIEQENSYYTQIGHRYYTEMGTTHNYLEPISAEGNRIDGKNPSIQALGMRYEPSLGTIKQPEMQEDYTPPDTSSLFYSEEGTLEVLTGERYQIGIRDISLAAIQFVNESQYISTPFEFKEPIRQFILTADHYIPAAFGDGEWIKYYISIDNGVNWIPVTSGRKYNITQAVKFLRVMIVLSRPMTPDGVQYQTPIVYKYELRGRKL